MAFKFFTKDGQEIQANLIANMPIGSIIDWAGDTAPAGWLLCDGSAVSRTDYADLFRVAGTFYGSGNGTTTFNIPDIPGSMISAQMVSRTGSSLLPVADGSITASKLAPSSVALSFLSAASTTARTGGSSSNLIYEEATITLTAGTWMVSAGLNLINPQTLDDAYVAVYNRTAGNELANTVGLVGTATSTTSYVACYSRPNTVTVTSDTNVCPVGNRNGASTIRAARGAGVGQVGWISALKVNN